MKNHRFIYIKWFYISLSNRISGPFDTRYEARRNKPMDWRCKPRLVSFDLKTKKVKTEWGSYIGDSIHEIFERIIK